MTILLKFFCNLSSAVYSWQKKVTLAPKVFIFYSKNCAKHDMYRFILKYHLRSRCLTLNLRYLCSEIVSVIVSFFTSMYVVKWKEFFPQKKLKYPPSFDGRAVCYPSSDIIRDYLAWRQVDCEYTLIFFLKTNGCTFWGVTMNRKVISILNSALKLEHFLCQYGHYVNGHVNYLFAGHINNQYNTCFWMLVKSGKSKNEAQGCLKVVLLFILY